jgi:hypothetical protein
LQEALLITGLTAGQFEEMIESSYNTALALQVLCAQKDLILWAGKFQYAISKQGLTLINTLGPRELLLGYADVILPGYDLPQVYPASKHPELEVEAQQVIANQLTGENLYPSAPALKQLADKLANL